MIELKNKKDCCGCYACKNVCPRNAISMVEDEKEFKYPKINYNYCIKCGLCEKVCPIINESKEDTDIPLAYAAFNIDEQTRMNSSSGGLFSLIAEYILNNNGIVFGAIFDENFLVKHIKVEKIPEISKMMGSKYIQSNIGETYKEARKYLNEGKLVLYTGTPCQIEGLKKYLMRDYDNLYTQDLICHGVPSKKVWKKYLDYRKNIDNDILENISFRNKENRGWNEYELLFKYKNSNKYINHIEDIYMKIFLSDIALRDSCFDCKFKKKHRISDITLADFWGINNILPEMNDEKGTSLLIINSLKGKDILNNIKDKIKLEQVNFEEAIKQNPSMIKSPKENEKRESFFIDLENNVELPELVEKYIEK